MECLSGLHQRNPSIMHLRLKIAPRKVGNKITFSNFLRYDGKLVAAVRKLAPRVLDFIICKEESRQLFFELDLTYLDAAARQSESLLNDFTVDALLERELELETELSELRDRFEYIVERESASIEAGLCKPLGPLLTARSNETNERENDRDSTASIADASHASAGLVDDDPLAICTDIEGSDADDEAEDDL